MEVFVNKKDAYYFSHDSNAQDDPKCMMLIDDLGMEGYGIFWALIEKLRAEKDYTLPLSICGRFARRWATSEAKIQTVVTNYGLFEIDGGLFFSLRLKRSMDEKSQKARLSAEARWTKNQQLTDENLCVRIPNAYDRNANGMRTDAIKVKESKENQIEKEIRKNSKKPSEKTSFSEFVSTLKESLQQPTIDYLEHCKSLGKGFAKTGRAIELLISKIKTFEAKYTEDQIKELLESAIISNWKTIYEPDNGFGKSNKKSNHCTTDAEYTNLF
jgi:hypothetical protein